MSERDRPPSPLLDMTESMRKVREALATRPWEARAAQAKARVAERRREAFAAERQRAAGLPADATIRDKPETLRSRFKVLQGGKA